MDECFSLVTAGEIEADGGMAGSFCCLPQNEPHPVGLIKNSYLHTVVWSLLGGGRGGGGRVVPEDFPGLLQKQTALRALPFRS